MLVRTETPDACDTCGLDRASRTISSTISAMNRGTSTCTPLPDVLVPLRSSQAFCSRDLDSLGNRLRIMRANHRPDAVLQRRHDPPAIGVILRDSR